MSGFVNTDLESIDDFKRALTLFLNDTGIYINQTEQTLKQLDLSIMLMNNDLDDDKKDTLKSLIKKVTDASKIFEKTIEHNSADNLRETVLNILSQILNILEEYKRI